MADRLVGFGAITDVKRAKAFYVDTLGLEFVTDRGVALVLRSGENQIRLLKMDAVSPAPYTVLGWECADIEARVRDLSKLGVRFLRYEWMQQDALGIWTAPTGDRIAWFQDPDGNVLSLAEHV